MFSDAERRVLAEIELALHRDDAKFVARFDERRIKRRPRLLIGLAYLTVLFVAALLFVTGAAAAALAWVTLTGCAATVVALSGAMNPRDRGPR